MWLNTPFGVEYVERKIRTALPDTNHLTSYDNWLAAQNGHVVESAAGETDPVRRYMYNGRSISRWVHLDILFQAYFEACLIMAVQAANTAALPFVAELGLGVPYNPGNPYNYSSTQVGFGTFGVPMIKGLMCEVATRALKAVWYQKWYVHRRLRPEEFGERVDRTLNGIIEYPINCEVLDSQAVQEISHRRYVLPTRRRSRKGARCTRPMRGPRRRRRGVRDHPQGHVRRRFVIENPVMATADGLSIAPYSGPPLTVGGELNKLATNVAFGRNLAGVHWRSDAETALRLGEAVAISILRDQKACYNESFDGFTFTKFDGTQITV